MTYTEELARTTSALMRIQELCSKKYASENPRALLTSIQDIADRALEVRND